MESGSLELKVMFCKDVKGFNFFQKLLVYAQASIVSDDIEKKVKQPQQQRTPTDKEGDANPEWKHEMQFDLKEIAFNDCDHIFLLFELKHEGVMFGDKTIGEVKVPLKDLILEFNGVSRFVEYEVRNAEGKPNGVLTFSYKVNGNGTFVGPNSPRVDITGYQIAHQHQGPDHGSGVNYPPIHVHTSQPEVHYPYISSPPGVAYPPVELHNPVLEMVSTPQAGQYSSPRWQESYYPQPASPYYPPPPMPPPTPFSYPPPPPQPQPTIHGEFYHPPHPWRPEPVGFHSYSMPGTWSPAANMHPGGNGETYPNGFDHRSSSWNGR